MKAAQKEIRSTVTVNTIDLGNKKRDDDNELMTSSPRIRGKEIFVCWGEQKERTEANIVFRSHLPFSSQLSQSNHPNRGSEYGVPSLNYYGEGVDFEATQQTKLKQCIINAKQLQQILEYHCFIQHRSFHYDIDEVPDEFNSYLYYLAYGKIGLVTRHFA